MRLLIIILLLTACTAPTAIPPSATSTSLAPAPTQVAPSQPAPTVPPSATPPPVFQIGLVSASPDSPSGQAVSRAREQFGWAVAASDHSAQAITTLAQTGVKVIVVDDPALGDATYTAAKSFPASYFVGVNQTASGDALPNLLLLGAGSARYDQVGFIAGMVAGFATESEKVAVLSNPVEVIARSYRNGFLHGVRYACPLCRVDFIDLTALKTGLDAAQTARLYASLGFDVIFGAGGETENQALLPAADRGAWVVGSNGDIYATYFENGAAAGADNALTSVYLDPGAAVFTALMAVQQEQSLTGTLPFSAATGSITLAPYRDPTDTLSAPDRQDIATALARLADGSLETGIDPVTGEEK